MTVRLIDTTTVPNETRAALKSLRQAMTFSSQDWSTAPDFAWLYGILVGWTDEDGNDTVGRFAERFGWDAAKVNRLPPLCCFYAYRAAQALVAAAQQAVALVDALYRREAQRG